MNPATKNTTPWDLLCGSAIAYAPITTNPVPTIKSVKAAKTVLQFSLTFGCRQQYVFGSLVDRFPYSWISESLSREVVSSVYFSVLLIFIRQANSRQQQQQQHNNNSRGSRNKEMYTKVNLDMEIETIK